ncbi:histidine kinase [Candidatus Endobugula sertula]|uniref:histidine kinase n=1 Tax=Candidatus Endobugula sertula TaxID=62101 RepID=A0A1D2QQ52_9GAMM|nr:histidine kinase [Candidatus Endobugula sertula]
MNKQPNSEHVSPQKNGVDLDFSLVLAPSVHDMKNSLSMLLNSLEEIIEEAPAENQGQKRRFSTLQYEATRINTELIQLLSLYRFQNQTMVVNIDENFVMDTIEDQVARNDILFKTQEIELEIDCDENLSWYYDSHLIGSVIHNVLVNGTRYASHKMHLGAQIENDCLLLTISDDGNGFPDGMINAASLDSEAHKDGNSTQFGLFFAAQIAQVHKQKDRYGKITLSNGGLLGGGVFEISLP